MAELPLVDLQVLDFKDGCWMSCSGRFLCEQDHVQYYRCFMGLCYARCSPIPLTPLHYNIQPRPCEQGQAMSLFSSSSSRTQSAVMESELVTSRFMWHPMMCVIFTRWLLPLNLHVQLINLWWFECYLRSLHSSNWYFQHWVRRERTCKCVIHGKLLCWAEDDVLGISSCQRYNHSTNE